MRGLPELFFVQDEDKWSLDEYYGAAYVHRILTHNGINILMDCLQSCVNADNYVTFLSNFQLDCPSAIYL